MLDIFIDTNFCGGHHLRDYPGNCEKPHGHNWKVTVTVRATRLDHLGMGIDFKVLKGIVNRVIDELDHQDLNELPPFRNIKPLLRAYFHVYLCPTQGRTFHRTLLPLFGAGPGNGQQRGDLLR